ncbi:hypothetical protein HD554DRAFT_2311037 [Boletus coccyginus]|nr:hypothetical protein HD554DRAFT_2311037 [Boletus coccyginus]
MSVCLLINFARLAMDDSTLICRGGEIFELFKRLNLISIILLQTYFWYRILDIDEIKQELVEMLRKVGFKLSNGRLPWSTLEGDLQKKGYMIVNWPRGVVRDRDKGVSGLSAEDVDKLHDALFVDEQRLQFVPCGEECAYNSNEVASLAVASGSHRPHERDRSRLGKQPRFRVTTAEEYPCKKRRV